MGELKTTIELDKNDAINKLYLYREKGKFADSQISIHEVRHYIDYLQLVCRIKESKEGRVHRYAVNSSITTFLKSFRGDNAERVAKANENGGRGIGQRARMRIDEFNIALERIFAGQALDPDVAMFFLTGKNNVVNRDNLWQVLQMDGDLLQETKLPFDKSIADKMFKQNYRFGKVFAIQDDTDLSKFKHRRFACHGTNNDSVLSILKHGFISSRKVYSTVQMGQMYGQGVYFALPSQISKCTGYMSNFRRRPNYIFLTEIGYNEEVILNASVPSNKNAKYGQMYHAPKAGQYDRDELIVPDGQQIRLTHLVEVYQK